jgi:hypothetical protein
MTTRSLSTKAKIRKLGHEGLLIRARERKLAAILIREESTTRAVTSPRDACDYNQAMSTCFVIQPFDAGKFDKRYDQVFIPAITNAGLIPYRVDQDVKVEIPIEAIEAGIRDAVICLADITTDNPNVWYELGYAMALGRQVVMVCSEGREKYPFDIQHRTVIAYKSEAPEDFKELELRITAKIKALLEKGETLKQLASIDPIAPVAGLSQSELVVMATVAGNANAPDSWVGTYQVRSEAEREFITPLGITLALHRLSAKKLLEAGVDADYNGNPYDALRITHLGWNWIDENESSFVIRRSAESKTDTSGMLHVGIKDEDIPF